MSLSEPLRYQPDNADFGAMLAHFRLLEPVFDALPDVAFFVKDAGGRYAIVNRTLAMRCGCDKRDLLGKTADECFRAASAAAISSRTWRRSTLANNWWTSSSCTCIRAVSRAGA